MGLPYSELLVSDILIGISDGTVNRTVKHDFHTCDFSLPVNLFRIGPAAYMTLDVRWNVDTYMAMNGNLFAEVFIWNLSV